jgi:hypothetical protein
MNNLFYSEHENSLRRFLVFELMKQSETVEVSFLRLQPELD